MKLLKRMSLRRKLLASYMLVFCVAMATLTWYAISSADRMVYENNSRTVMGMVEKARDNLDRKIEQYEQSMTLCAYSSDLQVIYANKYASMYDLYYKLDNTFQPFFRGVLGSYIGDVEALRIFSTRGLNKFGSHLLNADSVSDEDWFKYAMAQMGISWNVRDGEMYATCRIEPTSSMLGRQTLGLLFMQLDVDALLSRYVQISWPSYRLTIRDRNGAELISSSRSTDDTTPSHSDNGADDGADDAVMFTARSVILGWELEFSIPEAALHSSDTALLPYNMAVIIVGAAALLALIFLLTSTFFRGLEKLNSSMAQVEAGRLDVTVTSDSHDEIGVLANTFNTMLATIRSLIEQTKETERQLSGLELRALRAQIDPHFLYNTLSFINWKCIRAGQDDVSEVIEQLSIFYRTCLNKGRDLTNVRSEIANVTAYINIQLRMHDSSFDASYDIPAELYERRMLSFVLQPLVENAILHGIDMLRTPAPASPVSAPSTDVRGLITISLHEADGKLVFTVTDNGPGLTSEALERLNSPKDDKNGYGVKNVRDRIRLCYGPEYGVYVENVAGGGCSSRIELPSDERLPAECDNQAKI